MTDAWNEHPLNGCLFETKPSTAPALVAPPGSVPEKVDLRSLCSPVENQGQTNSCTANAVVGALEYHQRKAGSGVTDMSRLFVYYNARRMSDTQSQDTGSFIHHAMAAVLAYGACEERLWPFNPAMTATMPSQQAYQNAMSYEAVQYARTELGNSAMAALAVGLPVVFGTYIPGEYYQEAARTGSMPVDGTRARRPASGHAMLLVGYDIPAKVWIVRNSWGPEWADGGYFRLPFETLASYSDPAHFWTIGAIEKAPGFSLAGPTMDEMKKSTESLLAELRKEIGDDLKSEIDEARKGIRSRLRDN